MCKTALIRVSTFTILVLLGLLLTQKPVHAERRTIRGLGAESRLYKNDKLPQLPPVGSACTDFEREPYKFTLRLITKGNKAVALIPDGAVSGNIVGNGATLSSTKTTGEVGVGDWYVIQYVLKLKGIGNSSLQVTYQINIDEPAGSCDIKFKGSVKGVK